MAGLTEGISEWALSRTFDDIPDLVVHLSKEMMLNAVAVGVAGHRTNAGRNILNYVRRMAARPSTPIVGENLRSCPELAALANGLLMHVLDFDETFERRGNHPSPAIMAAVMSAADQASPTGREVIEAFAVGCEISTTLGALGDLDALKSRIFQNGWHLSGVGGTLGAAVASGRLLQLDQEQMENALGIAVSTAAGVHANYGYDAKSLHTGKAAMNGYSAAVLARDGFTGSRVAIEAADGYLGAFRGAFDDVDQAAFVAQLGNPYDFIDPGVGIKYYPCATTTHTSITAVRALVDRHGFSANDVLRMAISIPLLGGKASKRDTFAFPKTGLEAKFSVPYAAAVALLHGRPRIEHFTDVAVRDREIGAILERIDLATDEVATPEHHVPATVTIELNDGRVLKERSLSAKGHARDRMTVDDMDVKFRECVENAFPATTIELILGEFRRLDELNNVADLFAAVGTRADE